MRTGGPQAATTGGVTCWSGCEHPAVMTSDDARTGEKRTLKVVADDLESGREHVVCHHYSPRVPGRLSRNRNNRSWRTIVASRLLSPDPPMRLLV
jgi:hypothetical protein